MRWEDEVADIVTKSGMPTKQRDITVKETVTLQESALLSGMGQYSKAYNTVVPILADVYGMSAEDVWKLPNKVFNQMLEEMVS